MATKLSSRVAPVTDETTGGAVVRRRTALGLSVRRLQEESGVHRNTIAKIERDDASVEEFTVARVIAALDRLERRYSTDDPNYIVSRIELPDGSKLFFEGTPGDVGEAVAKYLAERDSSDS